MNGFERQSSLAALALRLIIAGFFGYHFYFKWQAGFAANVTSFELRAFPHPSLFAFVDMFVEALVIPFLVLGIYSRFCMIMLIPLMIGIFGVFWPRPFNFSMGGSELPVTWTVLSVLAPAVAFGAAKSTATAPAATGLTPLRVSTTLPSCSSDTV